MVANISGAAGKTEPMDAAHAAPWLSNARPLKAFVQCTNMRGSSDNTDATLPAHEAPYRFFLRAFAGPVAQTQERNSGDSYFRRKCRSLSAL
ncbi:hypothetical protein LPJ38_05575 [Bradyrhizobium daqingense]|uniref:hypothetical protein n=1 Tax=Bradyrhizobium daqingense TaxID=993502 RepID=UPI0011A2FBB3|nr:hypothetical protein [Bradyrhizobium daqingense]UFS90256.1 hypothetical protein LPJ38_05575 [Bradyrhizobium daqingense]